VISALDRARASSAAPAGPRAPGFLDAIPTSERASRVGWAAGRLALAARFLGALAVLATGAVHLNELERFYSQIPTIGTLFLLNFVAATVIGLALLAPVERIGGRYGKALLVLLVLAGIALAAVAFVFLVISEHTPLFGFKEPGYDLTGIATARAAEVATVLFLGAFLVGRLALKAPMRRW
jgi:hypothetical protein